MFFEISSNTSSVRLNLNLLLKKAESEVKIFHEDFASRLFFSAQLSYFVPNLSNRLSESPSTALSTSIDATAGLIL